MEGVVLIMGTTIRAWDQDSGRIRHHLFTTHKGTWSATWKRDGARWINEYEGKDLDGKQGVGKEVITFKGRDHYVLNQTNRTLDGKPQPDIDWHFKRKP